MCMRKYVHVYAQCVYCKDKNSEMTIHIKFINKEIIFLILNQILYTHYINAKMRTRVFTMYIIFILNYSCTRITFMQK